MRKEQMQRTVLYFRKTIELNLFSSVLNPFSDNGKVFISRSFWEYKVSTLIRCLNKNSNSTDISIQNQRWAWLNLSAHLQPLQDLLKPSCEAWIGLQIRRRVKKWRKAADSSCINYLARFQPFAKVPSDGLESLPKKQSANRGIGKRVRQRKLAYIHGKKQHQ